jgi:hypothetical protein
VLSNTKWNLLSQTRQRCRNPKCRCALVEPTDSRLDAFCCVQCFDGFFEWRCLVCEGRISRRTRTQRICRRAKCRQTWRRQIGPFGASRYLPPISAHFDPKIPAKGAFLDPQKPDRGWRQIAGPALSPRTFAAATVPDGPGASWEGGNIDRLSGKNGDALAAAAETAIAAAGEFTKPVWREVISRDGVRCLVTRWRNLKPLSIPKSQRPWTMTMTITPVPSDLTIPDFLRRGV